MTQFSAIWVGNPFFQQSLADLGWRVHWINPPADSVLTWDDLIGSAGFTPNIVIMGDKSQPPFIMGVESFPCLTAFYAVDTHIHSWYPRYAQAFDIALVSLHDHLPLFSGLRLTSDMVWWSPPYAHNSDTPRPPDPSKPEWDVLFVGRVDPTINPERHTFLEALKPLVPGLHVTSGSYRELYPQAKIVLNHAISGDLNFRVFEALGCGACLVTPTVRHEFENLFQNGHDLFTYDPANIPGLARLLNTLLKNAERRKIVSKAGHEKIAAGHYMHHRAQAFAAHVMERVISGTMREAVTTRVQNAKKIHTQWLRLIYLLHANTTENEELKKAYLKAAKN